MEQTRNKLADRFSIATTVPGTRSFHQIVPLLKSIVSMKQVSGDDDFALEFDFLNKKKNEYIKIENEKISQYLLCRYDEFYWIGMVSEIDSTSKCLCLTLCIQMFQANPITGQIRMIYAEYQG